MCTSIIVQNLFVEFLIYLYNNTAHRYLRKVGRDCYILLYLLRKSRKIKSPQYTIQLQLDNETYVI
jgi:hypothetical protein